MAAVLLIIVISITALYVAYVDCDILLFEGILKFLGSGYFMIKSVPTFLVYYSAWLSAGEFSKFRLIFESWLARYDYQAKFSRYVVASAFEIF